MAKIVTVDSIHKMYQKDKIVVVNFKETSYQAIVSNSVKAGDLMVFIEADSILPIEEKWEFLRKKCFHQELNGFLIKPMTMGRMENKDGSMGERVKSWGLAVSLEDAELDKVKAGQDVTKFLNIRKYEPIEDASPAMSNYPKWVKFCLSHTATRWLGQLWKNQNPSESNFPEDLISKSDETTVQNMIGALEEFANEDVYITAKIEGQSVTALLDYNSKSKKVGSFYVCSRNSAYKKEESNGFWRFAKELDLPNKFVRFYKETGLIPIIQAEQCGPGIQQNIYNFPTIKWFVYEIKTLNPKTRECVQLNVYDMIKVSLWFGLSTVPIINGLAKLKNVMPDLSSAEKYAETKYWTLTSNGYDFNYTPKKNDVLWKDYFQHEGVVVRSINCDKDKGIGLSMKIKNLDYQEQGLGKIHNAAYQNSL